MPPFDTLLTGLARERASGSIRLGRTGTVFLADGRVTYMECAQTPGVEDLLAASGRVSETVLRKAQREGGDLLVDSGAVTRGELQFCVLGAVLDAALFLLPSKGTRPKFRPGERHWLGAQWYFEVAGLIRECARRQTRLAGLWPTAEYDTSPVVPVPSPRAHRIVLSDLEWEVLVHTDREATPLDLARRLGRPAYSTLLAVRRLASAGLLQAPRAGEPAELPRRVKQDYDRPPARVQDPTDLNVLVRLKKALEELS